MTGDGQGSRARLAVVEVRSKSSKISAANRAHTIGHSLNRARQIRASASPGERVLQALGRLSFCQLADSIGQTRLRGLRLSADGVKPLPVLAGNDFEPTGEGPAHRLGARKTALHGDPLE